MRRTLAIALASASLTACAYNADLGRNQFLIVSDSSLEASAAQAWDQTLSQGKISRDAAANAQVRRVATRIIDAAGLGGQQWDIVVFDDPAANAFVLPGGHMGVNTGLLKIVANDDQLAAVIGHEVGHAVAHHAAERASQTAAASLVLSGAQGAAGDSQLGRAISAYGGAGAQLGFLLPFSRKHELEADRLGVDYMHAAGYDVRQAVALWQRMAEAGGAAPPELASTHPSDSTRIQALGDYIQQRGWA